jgi:hypothetical protein
MDELPPRRNIVSSRDIILPYAMGGIKELISIISPGEIMSISIGLERESEREFLVFFIPPFNFLDDGGDVG